MREFIWKTSRFFVSFRVSTKFSGVQPEKEKELYMRYSLPMRILATVLLVAFAGCGSTTNATDFSGLSTPAGNVIGHMSTSNMAVHILGKDPVWGDASLETTVADFTSAAKAAGASKVRIVQSKCMKLWFIFFPFSILVTPVLSNVAGDALK